MLINNAALVYDGLLATLPVEDIGKMVDVNLKGTLYLTRECLRIMLLQSSGRIINIASVVGLHGYSGLAVYASTKAALLGLTRSLAREVGPKSITVNAVAPGYLETEMTRRLDANQVGQIIRRTPLGRLGSTGDIVGAISFLTSESASFITGQILVVDGGLTS